MAGERGFKFIYSTGAGGDAVAIKREGRHEAVQYCTVLYCKMYWVVWTERIESNTLGV